MSAHALAPVQRIALAVGRALMPDDRPTSRRAMLRLALTHWRHGPGARRLGRQALRSYRGAQRAWIVFGAGAALYVARAGWWQIPVLVAGLAIVVVWG